MQLQLITNFEELESHSHHWNKVAGPFPFFRWNWVSNWFRYLGNKLELAVLVATDDEGNWTGIAPWCIDSSMPFARKLRFLGSGDACSDYLDLICSAENYRSFAALATDWLVGNIGNPKTLGRIDVVELDGITLTNPNTNHLDRLLDANGLKSHTSELEGGWVVDLPQTWEELNASFSKSMRRKTKKAVQRVADPNTEILSSRDVPFNELWPIFTHLHQQRRNMLGQEGCFASQDFENFLRSAASSLVDESQAELLAILHAGTPLATMLLLNDNETVYTYQNGMDVERLHLEPGYQICYTAIQRSIERGFTHLDFLRGDEPYKSRWNTTRIPIVRKRYVPRTTLATIKHGIWLTGKSIKQYVNPAASTSPSAD